MSEAIRWCFTINNPTDADKFWLTNPGQPDEHPSDLLEGIEYLILQEERGEEGTIHWQGFLRLKKKKRLGWLKRRINERAHWEIARGTDKEASDYCKKDETYTGGLRYEYGHLPEPKKSTRDERRQRAAEELDIIKTGFKRPADIPSMTLMECGFLPAYKELTSDILGPYRPNLQIITMVGPPGTGKSYAINHFFPDHGLCMPGNSGVWFQNPCSDVMVFEEFKGQIPLQKMLKLLDPYPYALEIKGGMRPANYNLVIITSNISPYYWYQNKDESEKQTEAIKALWDRLGYSDGNYAPVRECGHYLQCPKMIANIGLNVHDYSNQCRDYFWNSLARLTQTDPIEDDDENEDILSSL